MFRLRILTIGLLLGPFVPALGANGYVIAVIDPNRVVEQSPQYEAARQALKKELTERDQELADQQAQIAELNRKLEQDAALMSEEEIQRLTNDIRNRDRKLKYAQAEAREDITLRQNEMRTKLGKQVEEVVTELATQKGIDLIVSGDDVFYFSQRIDISDEVVGRMRSKHDAK